MKKEWIRSLKYLVWLMVLFGAIFMLMIATETARGDAAQMLNELLHTTRGWMMLGALLVLAYFYPRFGFTRRTVKGSLVIDRDKILGVAHRFGFSVEAQRDEEWVLRASSPLKKALLLWEDRITITQQGDELVLDGIRKEVVRMVFRLKGVLDSDQ